ncbi:hypothetical protein LRAMOSA04504 [Lichtheimia ramosa]|uniref:Yeast cell wall synthesis Kre9/Knh1-like N-terminal domain-containing protein n=1 Tax=Lichtheimia ramosa TaxID=688394 RepID=A0A077WYL4_9FUNG|nr:hypothetical protein LRAMOSA04504 [Lichtheimia ramosa]
MQITLVSIAAVLGMLSNAATASPIKRQQEAAPFTITEPAESTVVGSGQNLAISWVPGDNTPVTIGLAPASANSTQVQLAEEVNGSSGSHVIQLPSVVDDCSQWKISLAHGDDTSAWSKPFFITTSNDTNACVASPSVTPTPSATMLHDRLSGATMSASIDILGDDGQPVHRADSASNSLYGIATPVSMLGAAAISALVLTF